MKLDKVVSGFQTGADRAGINVAIMLGIPYGGFVPKGRRAEDGRIPDSYHVTEMDSVEYPPRTQANIASSDGTVIFTLGKPERGSALTISLCEKLKKPYAWIDLDVLDEVKASLRLYSFIKKENIKVLNVAGNRESKAPGIGSRVEKVMIHAFLVRGAYPIDKNVPWKKR